MTNSHQAREIDNLNQICGCVQVEKEIYTEGSLSIMSTKLQKFLTA